MKPSRILLCRFSVRLVKQTPKRNHKSSVSSSHDSQGSSAASAVPPDTQPSPDDFPGPTSFSTEVVAESASPALDCYHSSAMGTGETEISRRSITLLPEVLPDTAVYTDSGIVLCDPETPDVVEEEVYLCLELSILQNLRLIFPSTFNELLTDLRKS